MTPSLQFTRHSSTVSEPGSEIAPSVTVVGVPTQKAVGDIVAAIDGATSTTGTLIDAGTVAAPSKTDIVVVRSARTVADGAPEGTGHDPRVDVVGHVAGAAGRQGDGDGVLTGVGRQEAERGARAALGQPRARAAP